MMDDMALGEDESSNEEKEESVLTETQDGCGADHDAATPTVQRFAISPNRMILFGV